jgi:alkylation response protein AidB-like acyl-CoA dehydrogenase
MADSESDEQRAFRETLRRFLAQRAPSSELRRAIGSETGYDAALWRGVRDELALPGLAIDERHGGQGFGASELALVQRELGHALASAPFFASAVLAGGALAELDADPKAAALLTGIAGGETATLAWVEPGAGFGVEAVALETSANGRLRGAKTVVLDGHHAQHLLVVARLPGTRGLEGLTLVHVAGDAHGVARRKLESFDLTRSLARIEFADAAGDVVGTPGAAGPALARALERATIALCQEMVGVMERVVAMAVDYARTREQFGRAIGSFQAIKHKCADLWIALEAAREAADHATAAASQRDAGLDALRTAASLAKAWCSDACFAACAENIQIHGGVGFTWEHDAHLFFRRAKSSEIFLGDAGWHRDRLATAIGLEARA